jgi:hypothetical protein
MVGRIAPCRLRCNSGEASMRRLRIWKGLTEEESDENGWANLGSVGSCLTKIRPDFDPRLYGHAKLSNLFKKNAQYFSVEERTVAGTSSKVFYVKVVS